MESPNLQKETNDLNAAIDHLDPLTESNVPEPSSADSSSFEEPKSNETAAISYPTIYAQRTANCPLPIQWMNFYSKILMILSGVLGLLSISGFLLSPDTYIFFDPTTPMSLKAFNLTLILSNVVITALMFYLYFSFRSLSRGCFLANRILLILYPAFKATDFFLNYIDRIPTFTTSMMPRICMVTILAAAFATLVFSLPNFIYFEKRRFLFEPELLAPGQNQSPAARPFPPQRVIVPVAVSILIAALFSCFLGIMLSSAYAGTPIGSGQPLQSSSGLQNQAKAPTTEADKQEKAETFATLMGYSNYDEFIAECSTLLGQDLSDLTIEEQYNAILTDMGIDSYEEMIGYRSEYTGTLIETFGDYQDFLNQALAEGISTPDEQ